MAEFGLIGKDIAYSFSKDYFQKKFEDAQLPHTYKNYDLPDLASFPEILKNPNLRGLNVTIPYKETVMPYLDKVDEIAMKIGAVNTIKIDSNGHTKGYNTDYFGFIEALKPFLPLFNKNALILGTGGASKAIVFALHQLGFKTAYVSRKKSTNSFQYDALNQEIIQSHALIVNCTPVGTYPNIHEAPALSYEFLLPDHLLFDLIYNPEQTAFLQKGTEYNTFVSNGLNMLRFQADKAWKIWKEEL